jgi:hypothetical protein
VITKKESRVRGGHGARMTSYVLLGGGALLVATGVAFGFAASDEASTVGTKCAIDCTWHDVSSADAAGRRDETIGAVLDVAGAAAIIGGAILYYWRGRGPAIVPVATGSTHAVSLVWRF